MYVTTSRAARTPARDEPGTQSLSLRLAAHRVANTPRPFSGHDHDYFSDMFEDFGLTVDQDAFDAGRISFTDLVEELLPELGPYRDGFDLALMASATSDAEPGWPMCFLTKSVRAPGLVLGIADEGVVSPFTALRLAADWARTGEASRVLLFVLDQHSVLHTAPVPERLRARESAGAVMVLETGGAPGRVATPVVRQVVPEEVPDCWAAIVAEVNADADRPVTLIVGPDLWARTKHRPLAADLLDAPLGRPCTGIWALLAQRLAKWRAEGRRVVLADYDPDLGRLASCAIDLEPEP